VSLGVAAPRADRVRGVVLGNTWFWPSTASIKFFSVVMSSSPMQRRILQDNLFLEKLMPRLGHGDYSPPEWNHYVGVLPTPAARRGVAELPKQLRAADPLLADLERDVKSKLGDKPALLVWGHKDLGFRRGPTVARIRAAFSDIETLDLPNAGHYFQEEAPDEVVAAINKRFA
jgi:haloalkane dehalogenase